MKEFNPKQKSEGFGDTIAKITNATGWRKFIYGGYTSKNKYINLKM